MLPEPARGPEACRLASGVFQLLPEEVLHPGGTDAERAVALFDFVRDEIRYELAPKIVSRESWNARSTLTRKKGFCQTKSVLLVALARSIGIPAALCFQHIRDHKLLDTRFAPWLPGGIISFHGLAALWLEGHWVRVDPALDSKLCALRRYRRVEFDGVHEALLPATDLDGAPHFDFLGELGPFADFPHALSDLGVRLGPTWDGLRALSGATM